MKIKKLIILFMAVVALLGNTFVADVSLVSAANKKSEIIVGAPTQKTWLFEANKSGTYKIVFTYARPWEKDNKNSKTVEYTIKVSEENDTASSAVALVADQENIVKKGQKFSVTLVENMSTGYSWSYDIKDNGIIFVNMETMPLIGAPENKVWTFEAKKSGTYKLVFTYSRPWEKDKSSKTVVYTIKVNNKNGQNLNTIILINGKVNIVRKHQKFNISLEENASTGYSWSYKINKKTIKLTNVETENKVGAPTQKMWTFMAKKSGTYKIAFTYLRPWEKDSTPSKKVEYTVKVTDENSSDTSSVALIEGEENTIKMGQKFFVTLEDNASTGYSWNYNVIGNVIVLVE